MRILILGGDGMLGHQLFKTLRQKHEVRVSLRQDFAAYKSFGLFDANNAYAGIDVRRNDDLIGILADFRPQAVVNCVGIVKQRHSAKEAIPSIEINALFPHRLALMCEAINARMIHISTDCVFSGRKGNYTEHDHSDAEDLYGKSKYLGEVRDKHCVTLRSSIIGLQLSYKAGLIEWFLAQKGKINGFKRAIYSGVTTIEMSRVIERVLVDYTNLHGVWHVSSNTAINKFELLATFSEILERKDIQITPEENFICDRSLLSEPFKKETGYQPPSWQAMLHELAEQVKQREQMI